MSDRPTIASRLIVVWTPLAVVTIGAAMVLLDFWFGHGNYRLVGFSPALSRVEQFALPRVRYFQYGELYDLALHLAMLAVALAGALIFAALARRTISPGQTQKSRRHQLSNGESTPPEKSREERVRPVVPESAIPV